MHFLQRLAIFLLTASLILILFAGFFATCNPESGDRSLPYSPPVHVHFIDAKGKFHSHPFVYPLVPIANQYGSYRESVSQPMSISFFSKGNSYRVVGWIPATRHCVGLVANATLHPLGTDAYGRDVWSRLLYGGQVSIAAGLLASIITLTTGTLLGAVSGYAGGWLDALIMRTAELFLTVPWIYLLLAVRALLPLRMTTAKVFFILIALVGVVSWGRPARIVRGIVISSRERSYVLASRGFGASPWHLLRTHILPEARSVVATQFALLLPQFIVAEVILSYLGLGVGEPLPSWGNMLAAAQHYVVLTRYWWMLAPAILMIPLFWGLYVLADYFGE